MDNILLIILLLIGVFAVVMYCNSSKENSLEFYRDPLYLNVQKYDQDIYPRANGSIYGYPYLFGGSNSLFSGYPQYYTAY